MAGKAVGVIIDGEVTWHAGGVVHDYDTLCGIDADDPAIGHGGTVVAAIGQKITCGQCRSIWENTMLMKLRKSDFADKS